MVRLTIAELGSLDPRPIREVLRDAVATADLVHRDLKQLALHGAPTADDIARLMDAAKYCSALASAALSAGLTDPEPEPGPHSLDHMAEMASEALFSILDELTLDELPPMRAHVLRLWARDAVVAYIDALDRGVPPPKPIMGLPAAPAAGRATFVDDDEIVDAEIVLDDDDDGVDEHSSDALDVELAELRQLIHPVDERR